MGGTRHEAIGCGAPGTPSACADPLMGGAGFGLGGCGISVNLLVDRASS